MRGIYKYILVSIILLFVTQRGFNINPSFSLISTNLTQDQEHILTTPQGEQDLKALLDSVSFYSRKEFDKAAMYANKVLDSKELQDFPELKIEAYRRLGYVHIDALKFDSAMYYFNQAKSLSELQGNHWLYLRSLRGLATCYGELGKLNLAIHLLNEVLESRDQITNKGFLSSTLFSISQRYKDQANYDIALDYSLQALELRKEGSDESRIASSLISVANIYRHLSDYINAKIFADKAYEITIRNNLPLGLVYNQYGIIALNQGDYSIAFEYNKKAYEISEKSGNLYGMGTELNNMSISLRNLGRNDEALQYIFTALRIKREIKDIRYYAPTFVEIGGTYIELGDYNAAERYLDSALFYSTQIGLRDRTLNVYSTYVDLFEAKGDNKKALSYYRKYTALKDSIYEGDFNSKIAEYTTLYDLEQHKSENELLKKDNEIQRLSIGRNKMLRKVLYAAIILSVLGMVYYYFSNQKKKKANAILLKKNEIITQQKDELKELNATKDKFFTIIAHDLKSPFNSILGFTEILDKSYDKYTDAERKKMISSLTKTSKQSFFLLQNLLTWAKTQKGGIEISKEKIQLKNLLKRSISSYAGAALFKEVEINSEIDDSLSVFVDIETMCTAIGNVVNNGIKYTHRGGEIKFSAKHIAKDVILSINDNGTGMSQKTIDKLFRIEESFSIPGTANEMGTGLGLIICKEFIDKNGGKIWAESEVGVGSTFKIRMPSISHQ